MFMFKPVLIGFLNIVKLSTHKSLYMLGLKVLENFQMGYENLKGNLDGL